MKADAQGQWTRMDQQEQMPLMRWLSEALEPFRRRQLSKFLVVPRVRFWVGGIPEQLLHKFHENASNRMNGLMPVQTLADQPLHGRPRRRLIAQRDLILHDNVNRRVNLRVWQLRPGLSMVLQD